MSRYVHFHQCTSLIELAREVFDTLPDEREELLNSCDASGQTKLLWSIRHGLHDWTLFLLDEGANPNWTATAQVSPLVAAITNDPPSCLMVRLLLDAGAIVSEAILEQARELVLVKTHLNHQRIFQLLLSWDKNCSRRARTKCSRRCGRSCSPDNPYHLITMPTEYDI